TPQPDKPISFAALQAALKKAGYTMDAAEVTISGRLVRDDKGWWLVVNPSGQRFALESATLNQVLAGYVTDTQVEMSGDWKTVGIGTGAREVVIPRTIKKAEGA